MHPSIRKSGQFVVPGDRLGVIEEFVPGHGTYVELGNIYSKITGHALLDTLSKRVSVRSAVHMVLVPRVESIVGGQVSETQSKTALIRIFKIANKPLSGFFTGILHISDASPRYVETMFDACKLGDIVRAKVISEKNGIHHLSMRDENLGVLYAFCSECGYMLKLRKQLLICPRCGKREKRKNALDYGKGEI